jgi:hypothetical protein
MLAMPAAIGQQPAPAPTLNPGDPGYKLPSGVTVLAELTKAIDTKKIAAGDEVQAKVEWEIRYDGQVVVPLDAKIVGHVREVKAYDKDDPESRLRMDFEKIVLKDGREIPFEYPALVAALAPERRVAGKPNFSDLPVKAELGTSAQRINANPNIQGANASLTAGMISGTARGVIGLKGLEMADGPQGPVILAKKSNIKLEYGTQMVLIVATPAKK